MKKVEIIKELIEIKRELVWSIEKDYESCCCCSSSVVPLIEIQDKISSLILRSGGDLIEKKRIEKENEIKDNYAIMLDTGDGQLYKIDGPELTLDNFQNPCVYGRRDNGSLVMVKSTKKMKNKVYRIPSEDRKSWVTSK